MPQQADLTHHEWCGRRDAARFLGTATAMLLPSSSVCTSDDAAQATTTADSPETTSTTADPAASPSVDGAFAVDDEGRELALQRWGTRIAAVVIDAGARTLDRALVERPDGASARQSARRSCAYDRAGLGAATRHPNVLACWMTSSVTCTSCSWPPMFPVPTSASAPCGGSTSTSTPGGTPMRWRSRDARRARGQAEMSPADVAARRGTTPTTPSTSITSPSSGRRHLPTAVRPIR